MAIIKQLKDMFSKNRIYPVTVTKAVYDENGNRLSDYLNSTNMVTIEDFDNNIENSVPVVADRIGKYTSQQVGEFIDKFDDKICTYLAEQCVYINVKDLGAKGDGVSDDTSVIQQVLSNNLHAIVIFPAGSYIVNDIINIENKIIIGNDATIVFNSQSTERESIGIIRGTCNISNMKFVQNFNGKMFMVRNTDNTQIHSCSFESADGVYCGSLIDVYTNNQCLTIENCTFNLQSTGEGGLWIREGNKDIITKNVKVSNCHFTHDSIDEIVAVWGWKGVVDGVTLDRCVFVREDDSETTTPHLFTLGQEDGLTKNVSVINSTIIANRVSASIVKGRSTDIGGMYNNKFVNCNFVLSDSVQLKNGFSQHPQTIEVVNCRIHCEADNTNIGNSLFYSCFISSDGQLAFGPKTTFKNCEITMNEEVQRSKETCTGGTFINTKIDGVNTAGSFALLFGNDLIMDGFTLNGTITNYSIQPTTSSAIKVKNSMFPKGCYISGIEGITGYLINTVFKTSKGVTSAIPLENNVIENVDY